jgi:DNA-binding winged helix-turn-helix (wHTH) protein
MIQSSQVAFVHWPQEAAVAAWLRSQGKPRLLLVAAEADAPDCRDWNEDWIRLPARDGDVSARAAALEARSRWIRPGPEVKGDGRLCFEGRWVALSHTEELIAQVLSRRFGEVVDSATLASAQGDRQLSATAVRVHLTRLRKRIAPIGLVVQTVRGRGYVLDREGHVGDREGVDSPAPLSFPTTITPGSRRQEEFSAEPQKSA